MLDQTKINTHVLTIPVGSKAIFKCKSSTPLQWDFEGELLPQNAKMNSKHSLNIEPVELFNRGYYQCKGTTNRNEEFYARGLLKVIGKPE